jgi:hypothetical protein
MKGTTDAAIATYNMLGGSLEGFAVPIGLLQLGSSQVGGSKVGRSQVGSHLSNLSTPDVTDVTAIPKGLYEKLLELAKYDKNSDSKKQTKGRNKKSGNKKTRKQQQ